MEIRLQKQHIEAVVTCVGRFEKALVLLRDQLGIAEHAKLMTNGRSFYFIQHPFGRMPIAFVLLRRSIKTYSIKIVQLM